MFNSKDEIPEEWIRPELKKALEEKGVILGKEEEPVSGQKFDSEKSRMDLLPFDSLEAVSKVLGYGAKKYAPDNWRHVDNAIPRYEAAMLRHLAALKNGEERDSESGLHHIAHVACNALFLTSFYLKNAKQ